MLAIASGCPAADEGGEDTDANGPGTAADPDTSSTGEDGPSSGGPPADSGSADSGSGGTGSLNPECAGVPEPTMGFAIDLGTWSPRLDMDGLGDWQGSCTVATAEVRSTTLQCTDDPMGPPSVGLSFALAGATPPWAVDDVVELAYFHDGWSDGAYLSLRDPDAIASDGGLLLALGRGGGDGGFPYLDEFVAPLTVDENLAFCVGAGEGDRLPAQVTFTPPDGEGVPMLQGDTVTLMGSAGESYTIDLHQAENGPFKDHYGSFIDVVVQRAP